MTPAPRPRLTLGGLMIAVLAFAALNGVFAWGDRDDRARMGRAVLTPEYAREKWTVIIVGNALLLAVVAGVVLYHWVRDLWRHRKGLAPQPWTEKWEWLIGELTGVFVCGLLYAFGALIYQGLRVVFVARLGYSVGVRVATGLVLLAVLGPVLAFLVNFLSWALGLVIAVAVGRGRRADGPAGPGDSEGSAPGPPPEG